MSNRIRMIWETTEGERRRYGSAILALVLASCLLYLDPLVPQAVLDGVVPSQPGKISAVSEAVIRCLGGRLYLRGHLWIAGLAVVAITALAGAATYLRGRWAALASEKIARRLRERLYDQIQRLPCAWHDQVVTGDLIQRCTSDVETFRAFLAEQVVEIGRAVFMMLIPVPLMLALDRRMALVSVAILPPIVAYSLVFFRRVRASFLRVDEAEGRMTGTLQENLVGIRVVRAFARQDFEMDRFEERNRTHRDLDNRLYRLMGWFWSASDLMCMGQKGLVVAAGGYWLARGELKVGTFFFFLAAVNLFVWPIRMMGRILTELGKATVAIGRIGEVLEQPRESGPVEHGGVASGLPETAARTDGVVVASLNLRPAEASPTPAAAPSSPEPIAAEIEFDHVVFCHGGRRVLDDVAFRVAPGKTMALIGPSGAGKSSVVHLLLRFYDIEKGAIRLDGQDLRTLARSEVRSRIASVLQEPFLYSKTVRQNILLGRRRATDEEMRSAAAVACVDEAIREFEAGYDTLVGERGVTLSGGQRQRTTLARALLQRASILILDDALSAVDSETEQQILQALRRKSGRPTTLVVAHRMSTVMLADRILVLESGRLAQQGTHAELVRQPGLYRRLWRIQNLTEEPAESRAMEADSEGGTDAVWAG